MPGDTNVKVYVFDYILFRKTPYLIVSWGETLVPDDMDPLKVAQKLIPLKNLRYTLEYDNCKSQGLNLLNGNRDVVGNVRVFGNNNWLRELVEILMSVSI